MDFVGHASRYGKDAQGVIFRKTYPETEDIEKQGIRLLVSIGWEYKKADRTFVAPDGASLKVRYLEDVLDATAYQGFSHSWLGGDELTNWPTSEPIDLVTATLRSSAGVPCVRRFTGNPGGVGHHWVKKRYIDPAPPGVPFVSEVGTQAVFIPSRLEDNPSLGIEYERNIKVATFGNEALWKAWRHGDWNVIAGAAFPIWDSRVHVVRSRRPTDQHGWKIMGSIDWGYAKGAACLVMSRPDRMEVMDSVELERMTAREAGEFLAKRWSWVPEWNLFTYSPDMDTESGVGMTLSMEFFQGWQEAKVKTPPFLAGVQKPRSRRTKFVLFQQALDWTDDRDSNGTLRLGCEPYLVFHEKADVAIRSIPALPLDKKDPNDIDTSSPLDHCLAGWTPVWTPEGWVPIEDLDSARITAYDSPTINLEVGECVLTVTPEHRVLTPSGWVEAQSLSVGSPILWWNPPSCESTPPVALSGAGRSRFTGTSHITSADSTSCAELIRSDCTEGSGWTPMDRSPRGTMFTTRTVTVSTTGSKTSGASQGDTTSVVIPLLPHHLNAKPEDGTQSGPVERAIAASLQNNAVRLLSGVTKGPRTNVYDLSVDDPLHAFVAAGGFVVHNCYDAIGFLLAVAQPPVSKAKRVVYSDTETIQGTEWLNPRSGETHKRDPFRAKKIAQEEKHGRFGKVLPQKERIHSAEGF